MRPNDTFNEIEKVVTLIEVTPEELKLILSKRREDEIRKKRDEYIAELNDLFKRMREDGFDVYLDGEESSGTIAHGLESYESNNKEILDAINIF